MLIHGICVEFLFKGGSEVEGGIKCRGPCFSFVGTSKRMFEGTCLWVTAFFINRCIMDVNLIWTQHTLGKTWETGDLLEFYFLRCHK